MLCDFNSNDKVIIFSIAYQSLFDDWFEKLRKKIVN